MTTDTLVDLEKHEAAIVGDDPWMETYLGQKFFLEHEESFDQIEIEDIAHSLSLNCRYNGHCERFYSVAEHSVLISHLVPEEYAKIGLMHDATEAYLSDIVRPFKKSLGNYIPIENLLYSRIANRYGLPEDIPPIVKHYDVAICKIEAEDLMKSKGKEWGIPSEHLPREVFKERTGCDGIEGWGWEEAKIRFLRRFDELFTDGSYRRK